MVKITKTHIIFDSRVNIFSELNDLSMGPSLIIQEVVLELGPALGGPSTPTPAVYNQAYPRSWFDFIDRNGKKMDPLAFPKRTYYIYWSEKGFKANYTVIRRELRKRLKSLLAALNKVGNYDFKNVAEFEKVWMSVAKEHFSLIKQGKSTYRNKAGDPYGVHV